MSDTSEQGLPAGQDISARACYLNPKDVAQADAGGTPKRPLASVPEGKFFVLIQGGRNAQA
jgi:hypothetical protein